jgi:poly-gamma-glutamate capsule biosynthesis protein CapA/YwtB (metallophosphatase superfamily)
VTFAFAGDVHFEGPLRTALAADPATVLASIAPVLRTYDVAMVNLETAITERGTPQPKQYTFRTSPAALSALAAAGIDVATEANNHGIDFGPVGLTDTLSARAQSTGVKIIGIGRDADDAYTVAAQLVAAGADIIIGSHSHELEGAGHLGSALVDYGLGNFAFYSGTTTGILTVTMTGRHVDSFGWVPARISSGAPHPVVGAPATSAVTAWQGLRACTDLTP